MWQDILQDESIPKETKYAMSNGLQTDDDSYFVRSCLEFLSKKQKDALWKTQGKYTRKYNNLRLK